MSMESLLEVISNKISRDSRGEMIMGFENREINLVIIDLEDNVKPTVTYIASGVRTVFGLKRFTVTSEDIDKLALMEITLPHHAINAIHLVLDLSYNMGRILTTPDINLQNAVEVIYNVLCDRYKLPITKIKVAESLYADRKYHPFVKEVNQYINEIMSFHEVSIQEDKAIDSGAYALSRQQESDAIEEENPYLLSLDMEMKGLTVEQYSELITLVTSYVKKNNANGTKNCSLVIK